MQSNRTERKHRGFESLTFRHQIRGEYLRTIVNVDVKHIGLTSSAFPKNRWGTKNRYWKSESDRAANRHSTTLYEIEVFGNSQVAGSQEVAAAQEDERACKKAGWDAQKQAAIVVDASSADKGL